MNISKEKVEVAMARSKLTRNDLAKKASVPVPTFCGVLRRGACKPATAGRIAEALGVDVTEIIE